MDTYRLIDVAFNVFHLIWVVVALGSFVVFWIWKRPGWLILSMAMNATTLLGQIVWLHCPLVILQAMVWNHGHPENQRPVRSVTCDLVRDHLGVTILPWMVTASLAAIFAVMLWVAFRFFLRRIKSQDNK